MPGAACLASLAGVRMDRPGRPPDADLLVAAGLLIAALTEVWVTETAPGAKGFGTAVALLSTVPLAWRRQAPLVPVAGVLTASLLPLVPQPVTETDGLAVIIAWLVAVHAVNAYSRLVIAAISTLAVVGAMAVVIATVPAPAGQPAGDVVWTLAVFGAAAAAGQVMRRLRIRLVSERLAAEAEARESERRRLARELHDVVAHGVAVMVVQAGAAQELLSRDPERASALLDAVQHTGEQAAAELRRMLDLLGAARPELDPQPRLTDLPDLLARVRAAGLRAELDSPELADDVAPGLQSTAFRVVQESLTNALKHGSRSAVRVHVRSDGVVLDVTVDDDDVRQANHAGPPGHGLQGLRERVRLYGGSLQTGPHGSCWRVHARLPLDAAASAAGTAHPLRLEPEGTS